MTQGAGQIRPWSRKGLKNRFPNYAGHFPFDTYYFRTLLSPKIFSKREQYISNSCEPFEGSRSLWSPPWAKSRKQISGYLQGEGRTPTDSLSHTQQKGLFPAPTTFACADTVYRYCTVMQGEFCVKLFAPSFRTHSLNPRKPCQRLTVKFVEEGNF